MMDSDAKSALSKTIKNLRERLLEDLHEAVDSRYRMSVRLQDTELPVERERKRKQLEERIDERVRARRDDKKEDESKKEAKARFQKELEKEAAYTLLNRLVVLRLMEEADLSSPAIVKGGWDSPGYQEFRDWAPALCDDDTEGFSTLLDFVFDELAGDLPGLFGDAGAAELVPIPPDTLRHVLDELNKQELDSCWSDDTTLGWIYQYWNDPERKKLDDKLNNRNKLEPHEIAQKTQLFTERYMVEWLLQNSLGSKWLAICEKNGWTPECGAETNALWRDGLVQDSEGDAEEVRQKAIERIRSGDGPQSLLQRLAVRRADWRRKQEAGEVEEEQMMRIETDAENRWKYWVPRQMPDDAPADAPDSITELELLDPACGSGHFLVEAFDIFFALYKEEARHRGKYWSDREIVESILENNLYGIDIDPRAIQIAAAALYVKARKTSEHAQPEAVNLVAPNIQLANLPAHDPALVEFKESVSEETELSGELVETILEGLSESYHLGSLLKIGETIESAIREQMGWGDTPLAEVSGVDSDVEAAKSKILDELETFLHKHTGADDLGLRLHGKQLASGVRFLQINREDRYDVLTTNPPYQATSDIAVTDYIDEEYEEGKKDLYSVFLMRAPELCRDGGTSSVVTNRNWMFIERFTDFRQYLNSSHGIELLGDLDRGAFDEIAAGPGGVAAVMTVFSASKERDPQIALRPSPRDSVEHDLSRKRAALLAQLRRFSFDVDKLAGIEGQPLIYWWDDQFISEFSSRPKLEEKYDIKPGLTTGNNRRFLRKIWESEPVDTVIEFLNSSTNDVRFSNFTWAPYVKGASGSVWLDPTSSIVRWENEGLKIRLANLDASGGRVVSEEYYFHPGVAFTPIGDSFAGRSHRFRSIIDNGGKSIFTNELPEITCLLNSSASTDVVETLNPSTNFQVQDVKRLPKLTIKYSGEVFARISSAFRRREAHRESSVEFRRPGGSFWKSAQQWARQAVERDEKQALPDWNPKPKNPDRASFVSFAIGVALGRFGENGEGILGWTTGEPIPAGPHVVEREKTEERRSEKEPEFYEIEGVDPVYPEPLDQTVFPDGIMYVSKPEGEDSLKHPAAERIHEAWAEHGDDVGRKKDDLNSYLREKYFDDWVKDEYDKRPIYFPLSSENQNFVAHVSIHRWDADTLRKLLADHLNPELKRLEGRLEDMKATQRSGEDSTGLDDRIVQHQEWIEEIEGFIEKVRQCAEEGPPKYEDDEPERERDARYDPVLDDGVMINSAALWPLLEPTWDKPCDWWNRLAREYGYRGKHFDWSRLAAKYWPTRVYEKCEEDPSLAVAHDCFWKYHPEKAYEWELRLKFDMDDSAFVLKESFPDFILEGDGPATAAEARQKFFEEHSESVEEIRKNEKSRREREAGKDNHRPDRFIPVPEPDEHVDPRQSSDSVVELDVQGDDQSYGETIRSFRNTLDWSMDGLAEEADLSTEKLKAIETGEREPNGDELYAITRALEVSSDELESGQLKVERSPESTRLAARSGYGEDKDD